MRKDERLPVIDVIAQHAESVRAATAARDRAIVLARGKGYSLRQIAAAAGMTAEGVRKIIAASAAAA